MRPCGRSLAWNENISSFQFAYRFVDCPNFYSSTFKFNQTGSLMLMVFISWLGLHNQTSPGKKGLRCIDRIFVSLLLSGRHSRTCRLYHRFLGVFLPENPSKVITSLLKNVSTKADAVSFVCKLKAQ